MLEIRSSLALLVIPLAVDQWVPTPISGHEMPLLEQGSSSWTLRTQNSAGGFAYLLPKLSQAGSVRLKWDWRVKRYPVPAPTFPLKKKWDDYALRVGALLTDGENEIRVPKDMKKRLEDRKEKLSYIVFYCAVRDVPNGPRCSKAPYGDHILNCLIPVSSEFQEFSVFPIQDAIQGFGLSPSDTTKMQLIGLWLFSDSDNTHTASEGSIRSLTVYDSRNGERGPK